tara:strand:+ start:174 stop:290 length:117 start_codon:yes stop_codon:yes gene_type:complete
MTNKELLEDLKKEIALLNALKGVKIIVKDKTRKPIPST